MTKIIPVNVVDKSVKPKKPVVKKRLIQVDNYKIRVAETDLPHKGKVTLSDPHLQERGPAQELVVYATASSDTYEPGRRYACFYSLKGKLEGYFTVN
jgi:hypothetical protein